LYHDRSVDNIEKYEVAKKAAKWAISVAKERAYEDLYRCLSTKEEEKDICRMAKVRERKIRDFNQVKCIKDETEHLLMKENETRHRWRRYLDKLFNGDNRDTTFQLDDSFDDTNRHFVHRIQESKVRETLKRVKGVRRWAPDGIPIQAWRCLTTQDSYSMANQVVRQYLPIERDA
jgi:hypothetical protein